MTTSNTRHESSCSRLTLARGLIASSILMNESLFIYAAFTLCARPAECSSSGTMTTATISLLVSLLTSCVVISTNPST